MFTPDAITPQQRLRTSHRHGVRQIDTARVAVFGLPPSWHGERASGSTEFETGVTRVGDEVHAEIHESIELVHASGSSTLRVESSTHARPVSDDALLDLLGGEGACGPMTITVDGRDIAFAAARAGDRFAARWAGYAATVTVVGERWPIATGLELVRVTDFAPYHAGRLRLLEQRSGYDLS